MNQTTDDDMDSEQKQPPADIETASEDYAQRFRGSTGRWMLGIQERITLSMIQAVTPSKILDVGGGHGQLAIPLAEQGYHVTVTGSGPTCRDRIESLIESGKTDFVLNDQTRLPFADKAFDAVICFRLLPHCPDWPELIKELCRVSADSVIVDYPTIQSLNKFAGALFGAKKKLEGNTRPFALFRHREIEDAFKREGFELERRTGEFFLPMALHRSLRCAPLSSAMEKTFQIIGLTKLFGSPVITHLKRQKR